MLKLIFERYSSNENVYTEYIENYNKIINSLRKRKRLTELYIDRDIKDEIDNSMDSLILIRELQRQLEKLHIIVDKDKKIQTNDNYLNKEGKKLDFESDAAHYINNYKNKINKKSITSDERKSLFRCYYKDFYITLNTINATYDEWLENIKDERNDLLNLRAEVQNWHNILKKVLYGN